MIQHGPSWPGNRAIVRCVEFAQEAISGLALLELAGVNSGQPPQVYDWGGGAQTVCQIHGEPRQVPERCFGPVSGPNWSDWHATPAGWVARSSAASGYGVRDGDLEGWTYATGYGTRPPAVTFNQVCPPATPAQAASLPPATQSRSAPVTKPPAAATAPPAASASSTTAPSLVALAPSTSSTVAVTNAPSGQAPAGRGAPPTLALLATTVALLSALFVWNLRRRGS